MTQVWTCPTTVPRLSGTVALDLETKDERLKERGAGWAFSDDTGRIVGVGLSWDSGRGKAYYPLSHEGGGNVHNPDGFWRFLEDSLKRTDLTWIVHNRLYDEGWLRRRGLPIRGKVYDNATAAPLLNEYRMSYGLDELSAELLGVRKDRTRMEEWVVRENARRRLAAKMEGEKAPPKWKAMSSLWRMPGTVVGPYGEDDAMMTLRLWEEHMKPGLIAEDLKPIFDLETRLLPVLLEMRWRGVRVDVDRAEIVSKELMKRERDTVKAIETMLGFPVDIWANDSLERAFKHLGLKYPRTPTGRASFTAKWLEKLDHPVGRMIREARQFSKTRGTFVEGYVLQKNEHGRLHGEVIPLPIGDEGGAVTGRFAAKNPNTMNLINPEKNFEMGVLVRSLYLPEEGMSWGSIDFSQQEPRLFVHFANVIGVRGAQKAVDAYHENTALDFHNFMRDLCGLPRYQAKNIFLGKCYGMGGAKYCRDVGLPTKWIEKTDRHGKKYKLEVAGDEGEEQLKTFAERVPFVEGLLREAERRAKNRGWIRTLLGRKCRFGAEYGEEKYYKAVNRLIQGSAADQLKKAMIDLWDAGEVPHIPVHDELDHSVESIEHARRIGEIMKNAVTLRVPMKVDIDLGPNWGATIKQEAA